MQHPYMSLHETKYTFALIGNPVAHSLSPAMHNAAYRYLGESDRLFAKWEYEACLCEDEEAALKQINKVRMGHYRGMNVTMPYKRFALGQADFIDPAADAAGGANVLVRKGFDLHAYNTDGSGAVRAITRAGGIDPHGRRVAVCGTGPTSMAIVAAFAEEGPGEIVIFSRDRARARAAIDRLTLSLEPGATDGMRPAGYGDAEDLVPSMDVFVDATPCGMKADDGAVVDPALFHEGQIVFDVVYAHGITDLVGGARAHGALALDGLEMLIEQAALSIEIWADAMGVEVTVPRDVMRETALNKLGAVQ